MRPAAICLLLLLATGPLRAADAIDYAKQIKPILAAKCYACHGTLQQKSGLRLDTVPLILEGGNKGPALVAGQSAKSLLLKHVKGEGVRRMPPDMDGEPLAPAQIALLKTWIDQGAKGIADEKPEADPRDHWAFRVPVRPSLPKAAANNAIDAFIAHKRDAAGLAPQRPADRRLLLHRVYLDLIGLPPTLEEQETFLKDAAPDAYEKLVDRLLASPQYGERWGRHWMDVWRYSDWWGLGQEVRNSQKHIWHWRDWIIESVNADKGYDQMIREMIAADELYATDLDRLRATGFLARQYFKFNRTTWLDETLEHTSKAFVGLTMNCTKCHDHKYDPFAHADYYRLRAFFEPYQVRTDQVPGEIDLEKNGIPRAYDANLTEPTFLHIRGDDRNPAKDRPLAPGFPTVLTWDKLDIHPVKLPPEAHNPGLRPHVVANYVAQAQKKVDAAKQKFEKSSKDSWALEVAQKTLLAAELEVASIHAGAAADRAKATNSADFPELARRAAQAVRKFEVAENDAYRLYFGVLRVKDPGKKAEYEKKLALADAAIEKAKKAFENPADTYVSLKGAAKAPESPTETEDNRNKPFPTMSTGRRTALAKWLTDKKNPLTARVAVNHLWMRHFGRPLVATVFDFGRKGAPPSHPELLDWLAVEFMESGWSMKHLHRLMVTSNLYRLSSSNADAATSLTKDPENQLYWRMNPQRMEAQAVRDSLLHLAGDLDLKLGGPSIPVAQETKRRSLYFVHSHNDQQKFLSTFDDATVRECYRRSESIVPQQALALANSQLALLTAAKFHDRLQKHLGKTSDAAFVRAAFEAILAGTPTKDEQEVCEEALRDFAKLAPQPATAPTRARINLIHALLNHNDFITVR